MLSLEDFILILLIVLLANIISCRLFYRSVMYPFHKLRIYILSRVLMLRYRNIPINSNKNILFLCHGRHHGVPLTINNSTYIDLYYPGSQQSLLLNYIDIAQYNCYTVDREAKVNPHFVFDVLDPDFFSILEDETFDYVVLFNCACHTKEINDNSTVLMKVKRVLKPEGELIVKLANKEKIDEAGFTRYSQYSFLYNRAQQYRTYKEYIQQQIEYIITPTEIYTTSYKKCEPNSEEKVSIIALKDNVQISNNKDIMCTLAEIIRLSQSVQAYIKLSLRILIKITQYLLCDIIYFRSRFSMKNSFYYSLASS